MVMFSNIPATWRSSFARDVIAPSGVLQLSLAGAMNNNNSSNGRCAPGLFVVGDCVETPVGYDLSGDLVLVDERRQDALAVATASLRLTRLPAIEPLVPARAIESSTPATAVEARAQAHVQANSADACASSERSSNSIHIVRDDVLAQLLDYPVALSACQDAMVEVCCHAFVDVVHAS